MTISVLSEFGIGMAVLALSLVFGLFLYRAARSPHPPYIMRNEMAATMSVVLEVLLLSMAVAFLVDTAFLVF